MCAGRVQTRPNLKIQEGCGNRCTFCVIPWTRGPSKSLPAASVMRQVEGFVAAGGKELVLSGINLGRWGRDLPARSAQTLGRAGPHDSGAHALPRLRLSSIEPMDWDDELIGLMRDSAAARGWPATPICRCSPVPMRCCAACTGVTGPGTTRRRLRALRRAAGPDLTLGADVMVGFPGETDSEFEETARLHARAALRLSAPVSVFAAAGNARLGNARCVAGPAGRRRGAHGRASRPGSRKNPHPPPPLHRPDLAAITLHTPAAIGRAGRTAALTENFLPVELDGRLPANRLLRVRVTGLNAEADAAQANPLPRKPFVHRSPKPMLYSGCAREARGRETTLPRPARQRHFWRSTIAFDKRSAKSFIRINDRIRAREIRVIDENGEQLGILPPFEALKIARERGLDLVEVSPTAVPLCAAFRTTAAFSTRRKRASAPPARSKGHHRQGSQVLRHRGRARLPDQEEPGRPLPQRRRQGEGEPALPRAPDGAPRAGLQDHQPADPGHRRRRHCRVHAAHGRDDSARHSGAVKKAGRPKPKPAAAAQA